MKSGKFAIIGIAAVLAHAAGPSLAQDTITGVSALNTRLDDITRAVQTDLARGNDALRSGTPEFRDGMSGSASLGYNQKRAQRIAKICPQGRVYALPMAP